MNKQDTKLLQNTTKTLSLINKVNYIVTHNNTVEEIIQQCLDLICSELSWDIGHVYYVEDNILKPSALWYPNAGLGNEEFYEVTQNTEFKFGEGLPGKIYKHNEALIENITSDNPLTRLQKCKNIVIKSVMGCPIKTSHSSVYILEFFNSKIIDDAINYVEVVNMLAAIISAAIEKKEDEQLLQYNEKLSRAVIDSSKDSIILLNSRGAIQQVNPSTTEIFGYEERELIGQNINILMGDDHRTNHDGYIANYLTTGIKKIIGNPRQLTAVTKYKKQVSIILTVTEIKINRDIYFVGTIKDMTKLNLLEKLEGLTSQLKERSKELEAMNKELQQFAYITSHDLKAPLRAIENLAIWIEEDNLDKLDDDSKDNLHLLRRRVDRMANLIDGILEYSRAGKVTAEQEEVSVHDLLEEIKSDIDISPNYILYFPEKMPEFRTSKITLYQVFSNLISNAIKYHDKDKGKIEINYSDDGKFYKFSVKDDGPGIEEEYHDKIFQIFQTLQSRDKIDSTGIGLTIVKKLIESQKGSIVVNSELGKGSEFVFTWPKEEIN